ncbi:MAG: hypothetical protein EOP46_06180 [Sphingobacteriaceae bacterium]|nr:MAG: hypothetical protein EOP46_06180 [Sphingobacteriaceae bacterium]
MQRRSFLKNTAAAGFVTLVTPRSIVNAFTTGYADGLLRDFKKPPSSSAPFTWWHWMNGNITKQGITMDLEAMKSAGLGGFQLFEAGSGIPKGPVDCLSDEWVEMVKFTVTECKRLGLEFAMHNCPGWSSSGGPWITPELSMQQITWSEAELNGGRKIKMKLPEPAKNLSFYKDAAIVAIPSIFGDNVLSSSSLFHVSINNILTDTGKFTIPEGLDLHIKPEAQNVVASLIFEFSKRVAISSATICTSGSGPVKLSSSINGINYIDIVDIHGGWGGYETIGDAVGSVSFNKVTAKYFKLEFTGARHFSAIRLSPGTRLANWPAKANFRNAGNIKIRAGCSPGMRLQETGQFYGLGIRL